MSYYRTLPISDDKNLRAYIIGVAIGDGNLSNQNGRATKLRITCDNKYPLLKAKIISSLEKLLPKNKVGVVKRKSEGCSDVYVYSNHLELLLGWKAKSGSKFRQNVSTPTWIFMSKNSKINYIRGLIETDGAIYFDRGYPMVTFSTIIKGLAKEVEIIIRSLGFNARLYSVIQKPTGKIKYHVRLSKNVSKFLTLIKPNKS